MVLKLTICQVTSSNVDYVAKAIHEAVLKFQKWQQMPNDEDKKMTKILTVEF